MKSKTILSMVIFLIVLSVGMAIADNSGCICHQDVVYKYEKSLHYTWSGVEGEYQKGAGTDYGLAVPKGCYKCHEPLLTCQACHNTVGEWEHTFNDEAEPDMEKCLECHKKRPGANYVGELAGHKESGMYPDLHYVAGMDCMDCHSASEMHGDASNAKNQRVAVKVRCEDCHDVEGETHKTHEKNVDCAACHSGWLQTCVNCHLETGKIDSSNTEDFHLIIGWEGKVVPAYQMVKTYKNETTVAWTERTPHTTTLEHVRECVDCHENKDNILCEGCEGTIMVTGGEFIGEETIEKVIGTTIKTDEKLALKSTVRIDGLKVMFLAFLVLVILYAGKMALYFLKRK